jgi:hypothetical protein
MRSAVEYLGGALEGEALPQDSQIFLDMPTYTLYDNDYLKNTGGLQRENTLRAYTGRVKNPY